MVFVPAIIYAMRQYGAPDGAFSTLKKAETSLVGSLNKETDGKGNIGRRKFDEGKDLRYRPSTTYWAACNRFNLFGETGQERSRLLDAIDGTVEAENEDIPNEWNMFVRDPEFSKFSERLFRNPRKLIWHEKMSFELKKSRSRIFCEKN